MRGAARRILALTALAGALAARPAAAHDQPYSYLDLDLRGSEAHGVILAHVDDLAKAIGLPSSDSLRAGTIPAERRAALERELARRLRVRVDGAPLVVAFTGGPVLQRGRPLLRWTFRGALAHPAAEARVQGPLFPEDPQHQTYVNVYEEGALRREELLDASHPSFDHFTGTTQGTWAVVRTFVRQGIHHIFIGPDHILFILGLLLLGGGIARLLKIVTAFTLAHSLTLALATLGVVHPSARVVEPAIALSIVCVGVENLRAARRGRDWRAPLAFGFGLVHGFGFASVLASFGLPRGALGASLFAFNAGVELGQAAIVLVAAPALAWIASRGEGARTTMVRAGSFVVIAAGAYWLVERLLGA